MRSHSQSKLMGSGSDTARADRFTYPCAGRQSFLTECEDLEFTYSCKIIYQSSKAKKHIDQKKIVKTIFVKNKIINYIVA